MVLGRRQVVRWCRRPRSKGNPHRSGTCRGPARPVHRGRRARSSTAAASRVVSGGTASSAWQGRAFPRAGSPRYQLPTGWKPVPQVVPETLATSSCPCQTSPLRPARAAEGQLHFARIEPHVPAEVQRGRASTRASRARSSPAFRSCRFRESAASENRSLPPSGTSARDARLAEVASRATPFQSPPVALI